MAAIATGWTEQPGFPLVKVTSHCEADGGRTITLSQSRFLLRPASGEGAAGSPPPRWSIPLRLRSGAGGTPRSVLLTQDGQREGAGSCREPLSVNSDAIGFFRVQYDADTLSANTHSFASLPDGDRIALLDDQWALVEAGSAQLSSYLTLASGMGDGLDVRAWEQIAESLGNIEYDERATPGHDAFAAYARSVLKPVADRLGWDAQAGETPALQKLRRRVLQDLALWGDPAVRIEAQKRFSAFVRNRSAISPDDQSMVFVIVGRYADVATFEQLTALARDSKDDGEQQRLYLALANVRDPDLAMKAAQIALSKELPAQDNTLAMFMISTLREEQPKLAWDSFTANQEQLLAPWGNLAPLMLAQYVPQFFWNSLPLEQLEAWLKAHTPAGMDANVVTGMQAASLKVAEKQALVPAADAYLAAQGPAG